MECGRYQKCIIMKCLKTNSQAFKMEWNKIHIKGIEMSEVLSNCANNMNEKRSGRGLFWVFTGVDIQFWD